MSDFGRSPNTPPRKRAKIAKTEDQRELAIAAKKERDQEWAAEHGARTVASTLCPDPWHSETPHVHPRLNDRLTFFVDAKTGRWLREGPPSPSPVADHRAPSWVI